MDFLKNTEWSRKTSQVSANWGHWEIVKKLQSEAVSSLPVLHKTVPYPGTIGLSYREGGMTTGTRCTGMKGQETHNTHRPSHTKTHRHTDREAWCTQAGGSLSDACLFPPGMQRRGGWEEKERWGWGVWEEGKKNRRRMKADAEQHQLRTTAAGEPDRARNERRETMLEEGKDRKNPH